MTQEEKQLLIKDLCARLPYGIIAHALEIDKIGTIIDINVSYNTINLTVDNASGKYELVPMSDIKPYLRSMSTMTEEEYNSISWEGCNRVINYSSKHGFQFVEITSFTIEILNWLNAHHFDYRGLIEKGLALEAKEGMYETNNE